MDAIQNIKNSVSTALATQGQLQLTDVPVNSGPLTILTMSSEQVQRIKLLAEMYAASTFNRSDSPLGQGDYFLIMLKGIELGISPTSSVDLMSIIQGKPVLDAKGILALVKGKGLLADIEMGGDGTSYYCTMKRKGESSAHKEVFTIEDAARLGLATKSNYKKQPKTMLKWRAVTACARVVFPDIIGGLYTHEEIDPNNTIVLEDGSMVIHQNTENLNAPDEGGNGKKSIPEFDEHFTDNITHIETRLTKIGQRYYVFHGLTLWTRQPFRDLFSDTDTDAFDIVLEAVGTHTLPDPLRAAYRTVEYTGDMGERAERRELLRLHRIKSGQTVDVKARPANEAATVSEDTIVDATMYDESVIVAAWDILSEEQQDSINEEEFWLLAYAALRQDPALIPELLAEAVRTMAT